MARTFAELKLYHYPHSQRLDDDRKKCFLHEVYITLAGKATGQKQNDGDREYNGLEPHVNTFGACAFVDQRCQHDRSPNDESDEEGFAVAAPEPRSTINQARKY